MTRSKRTKQALITSVLAVLLCVAMLVGSTFAWFTDSVTTGVNKIVAGNLDVELYSKVNGTYTKATNETHLFKEEALWEPGHVEVVNLKVANVGTLALKYQLGINIAEEKGSINVNGKDFNLSDFIKFAVIDEDKTFAEGDAGREEALAAAEEAGPINLSELVADTTDKPLYPVAKATNENPSERFITLIVYMPTTVDNIANYMTGNNAPEITLGVKLIATQTPYEEDSFGNNYDESAEFDPFAEKDKEALANGMAYRDAEGNYGKINPSDEPSFLLDLARDGREAALIRNIGASSNSTSSTQMNYSNKQSVLDLNGHTYTFGGLEVKQSSNAAENSSLVVKNGTMVGSTTADDMFTSYNAMQNVTLDHVNMKWNDSRAWNANTTNYYGLNLTTKTSGSVFTVTDSVLDCNASFSTNSLSSGPDELAVANITNTTVNGRLHGAGLTMNVDNCTVNGEIFCNASNSSKTKVNISNSTVNGNAFFDASGYSESNEVTVTNTTINGDLQTKWVRNNVHFTLTDVTLNGTLGYTDYPNWKIPADKVTIVSGTYGFDPTNYLAAGSTATQNGGVWVVTAG